MKKETGTLKGHMKDMLAALYLWTAQIYPERLLESLKKDFCFKYDDLRFEKLDENKYKLIIDFGDIKLEYLFTFELSKETNRWILSSITFA